MTFQNQTEDWDRLDFDAKVNLRQQDLEEFRRLKNRLKAEGRLWHCDVEHVLTGFIWDYCHPGDEESSSDQVEGD